MISAQENTENGLKFKLDRIKEEKNEEINRLKEALINLKQNLSQTNQNNDQKATNSRTLLIEET